MERDNLVAITEVGVFGSLDIEDPTVTEVVNKKQNQDSLDDLITEAVQENASITL